MSTGQNIAAGTGTLLVGTALLGDKLKSIAPLLTSVKNVKVGQLAASAGSSLYQIAGKTYAPVPASAKAMVVYGQPIRDSLKGAQLNKFGKALKFLNTAAVYAQTPAAAVILYDTVKDWVTGDKSGLRDLPDWVLASYGLKKDQYGNVESTGLGLNDFSLQGAIGYKAGKGLGWLFSDKSKNGKKYQADATAKARADEAKLKAALFDRMEIISVDDKGRATALVKHEGGNGLMTLDKDGNVYNAEGKKFTLEEAVKSLIPLTDTDRKELTSLMTKEQASTTNSNSTIPTHEEEYKYEDYLRTLDSLSISV